MFRQSVRAEALSCILNRDLWGIEPFPEPFRLQGDVTLCVAYSEYINYINSMPEDSQVVLSLEINKLKNLARSDSSTLYSYFLRDMAFAICKELFWASRYQTDGTVILPIATDASRATVMVSEWFVYFGFLADASNDMLYKMAQAGYGTLNVQGEHNSNLLKIAAILDQLANRHNATLGEVNLSYDLV